MRASDKGWMIQSAGSRFFGVDFHDRIEKEALSNSIGVNSEFGLTSKDVRNFKKHLERS